MEGVQYHTFSTSTPSRRGRVNGTISFALAALAVTALVAVVVMRSSSSRTELLQMSFPGIGQMVANWITEFGKLSNVDNIDGIKLAGSHVDSQPAPEAAVHKPAVTVSHLDKAAQLRRAKGWMFDAKGGSKGYLFHAPQREGWMERAPSEQGWMESAPTEKGWMFKAPAEQEPSEDPTALKRHAQGWMFDTKEAKKPVQSQATLKRQAQGWMFDLPSEHKARKRSLSPSTEPNAKPVHDVGAAWKQWATDKASSLHEKVHRIAVGPGGWEVYVDAKSGRPFYYNRQDGVSSWTSPWSAEETKKQLRSSASVAHELEHMPLSGMDAIRQLPAHVSKKIGRVFDVNAQEDDMNSYFDSLQKNIDRGITTRNDKLVQERGLAKWHPEHEERVVTRPPSPSLPVQTAYPRANPAVYPQNAARPHVGQHLHAAVHLGQREAGQPSASVEQQRVTQHREAPVGHSSAAAAAAQRAARHAHHQAVVVDEADGGAEGGWGRLTATHRGGASTKKRARGGNAAVVLRKAWDTMEGGEGSDLMAKDHM